MPPHFPFLLGARLCLTWAILSWLGIVLNPLTAVAADTRTGEQIYRQRCAKCHGPSGEGTEDNYPDRLAGNKSVAQLARFIAKKMPKDSPQKCDNEEAQKVAAYIYDKFYSNAAQERNKPPRIELARLTVRQYRNAVADLIGTFRSVASTPAATPPDKKEATKKVRLEDDQHGLRGEYFKSFGFRPKNRVLERIDPTVQFNFGEGAPDAKNFEPDRFSIRWEGALLAPETGRYEFIVRTEHAARLWLNDTKTPLIDAWVKSGASGDSEHSPSIFLIGGRNYPVRLEFAKGKQGEKDGKKDEAKPPPVKAAIALEWKLPQQAGEVIPRPSQEYLTRINRWYCEQLAYLVKRLAETPEPGGGGSLLDNTLLVWTNELGKGNSHTLDNIPFVLVGNGLDFKMGRFVKYPKVAHNRLLLSLAHGMGHAIKHFGNPNFCGEGPLPNLS
jgi:mono/diheme cytochrome c family protein